VDNPCGADEGQKWQRQTYSVKNVRLSIFGRAVCEVSLSRRGGNLVKLRNRGACRQTAWETECRLTTWSSFPKE